MTPLSMNSKHNIKNLINRISQLSGILILFFLNGCDGDNTSLKSQSLVYCSEGSPTTFNPQQATSSFTLDASAPVIYNRLLELNPDTGELEPSLAESWEISDNGLHYVFHLKQGVHFHHTAYWTPTRNLNSEDVLFSFNRQRLSSHNFHNVGTGKYPMFEANGLKELIRDIIKIDEHTVEFILTKKSPRFLNFLSMEFASIESEEYATSLMDNRRRFEHFPIGTGPFKFQQYVPDTFIRYHRNDEYFNVPPKFKTLVFAITSNASTRLAKMITHECDVMSQPLPNQLDIIRNSKSLQLETQPGLNVAYWAFNTQKKPFDDIRIRKALSLAVSRTNIIKIIYNGGAHIARSPLPPNMLGATTPLPQIKLNRAESRRLLKLAHWDSNFVVDIWAMPVQRPYNPDAKRMAELIQDDLAKVNVKSRIVSYEWGQFLARLRKGEHQTVLLGWSADNNDPDDFLTPLLSCHGAETGTNRAFWCDPDFDKNLRLSVLTDGEKKLLYLANAQQIFKNQLPWLPIAHSKQFLAFQNDLSGIKLTPTGRVDFSHVMRTSPSQQTQSLKPNKPNSDKVVVNP